MDTRPRKSRRKLRTRSTRSRSTTRHTEESQEQLKVRQNTAELPECVPLASSASSKASLVQNSQSLLNVPGKLLSRLSQASHRRSPSPARVLRQREHSELQDLNDRLSSHADHVAQLQAEKSRLRLQLEAMEGVIKQETQNIKQLHETDVKTLQNMIDANLEEKEKLEARYLDVCRERDLQSETIMEKEQEIQSLEQRVDSLKATSQVYNKSKDELVTVKAALEEKSEDVERLSAELIKEKRCNRRLEEEARLTKERYLKEMEDAGARFNERMQNADEKLEERYESMVSDALTGVREQQSRTLESLREELTSTYQAKLNELKTKCETVNADLLATRREVKTTKQEQDKLRDMSTQLKAEKAALQVQLSETRARFDELKDTSEHERCQSQREVALLRQELMEVKEELEELGGANSKLEEEINAYRQILDDLEQKTPFSKPPRRSRSQPRRRALDTVVLDLATAAKKLTKKRQNSDVSMLIENKLGQIKCDQQSKFFRTNEVSLGVEIFDVDPEGKYIKLVNSTDHPTDLCLWTLQQSDRRGEHVKYQIRGCTQLGRGQNLIIWSSASQLGRCTSSSVDVTEDRGRPSCSAEDIDREDFIRGQHLTMEDGKSWLKLSDGVSVRLEDGDSQLQAKCEISSLQDAEDPNSNDDAGNVKRARLSQSCLNQFLPFGACSVVSASQSTISRADSVDKMDVKEIDKAITKSTRGEDVEHLDKDGCYLM